MSKMREEFEKWDYETFGEDDYNLDSEGNYDDNIKQQCWMAWKASREHLVIDLPIAPSSAMYVTVDEAKAARDAHLRVVKVLDEQEVKYE